MEDKTIRSRNWFLTINSNSECWGKVQDIVLAEKTNHYAIVEHYKSENQHVHVCIEYKNAKTFTSVQSKYEGAHIELMRHKNMCYQYLIHKNDSDKEPYSIDEVVCDNRDYFELMLNSDEYEQLNTESIISDISIGFDSLIQFVQKYGLRQVNIYHNLITKLITEKRENMRLDFAKLNQEKSKLYDKIEDLTTENDLLWEVLEKNNLLDIIPIHR